MIRELRLILWFVLGVALSANAVLAFAATGCNPTIVYSVAYMASTGSHNTSNMVTGSTPADACSKSAPGTLDGYATNPRVSGSQCAYDWGGNNGLWPSPIVETAVCPYGGNPVPGGCNCPDPCSNKAGQAVDDGSVGPDNVKLSMNFPARPDDNYVGQTFCSGGCMAGVDKEGGASGMTGDGSDYGQFSARFSGQSCPAAQPAVSPKTSPALIPKNSPEYDCVSKGMGYGYVGETVKCVAKTSSKETENKTSETTKADGTKPKETKTANTVCADGACTTTTTTTTTEYNSSGTAVGTPTKTESTTKPDPNSGLGSGGTKEGQGTECGVSGKPPCAVKVDETDVKTDVATVDQRFKDQVTAAYDEVRQKMEQVTRPQNWGVTWVYAPPAGACTALQYGVTAHKFSLDVCKPLGYIRDLWSYVIYVMTGLYIWRSARDAMNIV